MQTSVSMNTARISLRRATPSDIDSLHALDNDPAVMRYINGGSATPRHVTETQIMPVFLESTGPLGFWIAELKHDGTFIGWFSLRGDRPRAELGYRLKRDAWGNGYATEGAQRTLSMGFDDVGLSSVMATTYEENLPSQRVLQRLGFQLKRRYRMTEAQMAQADTFHSDSVDLWPGDDFEYELTREDFRTGST